MESICATCGVRIVEMKVGLSIRWMHLHKGNDGFVDEMYRHCRFLCAKPIIVLQRSVSDENIKAFMKEEDLANSILRKNRYSTVPPHQWYGPDPEPQVEWDIDANVPVYTRDYLRMEKEKTMTPFERDFGYDPELAKRMIIDPFKAPEQRLEAQEFLNSIDEEEK